MSYDIRISDEHFNYTYNCEPMFALAFGCDEGINRINGLTGKTAAVWLDKAINYFQMHRYKLEKLKPPNGWGSYNGALGFLISLRGACLRNTRKRVHVT
jgi:hypothetical protein